jgi:hypothetical protein
MRRKMILILGVIAISSCVLFGQEQKSGRPERDRQSIEILTRVLQNSGGLQAINAVHDITETGEVTFYWGKEVKGPVTIRTLGANHFRMEADLPEGKSTWVVKDGVGSKKEVEKVKALSRENALNLCNLTYPIGHVAAALSDSTNEIFFVDVEKWGELSAYRLRLKGKLGLVGDRSPVSVVKDMIIDSQTFDILSVEDHPYPTYGPGEARSKAAPRELDFGEFRTLKGVRMPFAVLTKLHGQRTMSLALSDVTFNKDLTVGDFPIQK